MLSLKQKKVLKFLIKKFRENNVPFQVSGGLGAIAYGAKRPLYDIDVDIHMKDVKKVKKIFKNYIIKNFHHLRDRNFDIWLMVLEIEGINVDISQGEECYYLDSYGNKTRIDADLSKAKIVNIEGIDVPVEDKNELISYKKIIARDTDLADIERMERTTERS